MQIPRDHLLEPSLRRRRSGRSLLDSNATRIPKQDYIQGMPQWQWSLEHQTGEEYPDLFTGL